MRWSFIAIVLVCPASLMAAAPPARLEAPHVTVEYTGITEVQARSLAETLSAAREVYVGQFKFDMPERVVLTVECAAGKPKRLFTDGNDRVFLSLPDSKGLAPPRTSGVFNLYGMCHELGHVAMYRTLKERSWMSGAAAEGWAHYAGSVVVDELFEQKGQDLWFEPYDYRDDGTARLDRSLRGSSPSEIDQAADQWRRLEAIIGRDGFARLFAAWEGVADAGSADPAAQLLDAMTGAWPDESEELAAWWSDAAALLVQRVEASPTKPQQIARQKLFGHPITLKRDDDTPDGKRSIAGGGHAVRFDAPDASEWYLTSITVHGARYGPPKAPGTLFTVALCDLEMRPIQTWRKPYALFTRGSETAWVKIELTPTRVPQQFYICLDFKPSATNGVYVAYDSSTREHSRVATPGALGSPLDAGDWMIRVDLDNPRPEPPAPR